MRFNDTSGLTLHLGHDWPDGFWQAMSGGSDRLYLAANAFYRPSAWPRLKVVIAAVLPGFHFAIVVDRHERNGPVNGLVAIEL